MRALFLLCFWHPPFPYFQRFGDAYSSQSQSENKFQNHELLLIFRLPSLLLKVIRRSCLALSWLLQNVQASRWNQNLVTIWSGSTTQSNLFGEVLPLFPTAPSELVICRQCFYMRRLLQEIQNKSLKLYLVFNARCVLQNHFMHDASNKQDKFGILFFSQKFIKLHFILSHKSLEFANLFTSLIVCLLKWIEFLATKDIADKCICFQTKGV